MGSALPLLIPEYDSPAVAVRPTTGVHGLTKTVLYPHPDGTCSLLTVPFGWNHGDPLPRGVTETRLKSPRAALIALARQGRRANGDPKWAQGFG
jgi:hypothetical protein